MKTTAMAWRNVWRTRRRSLVTMAAMTFALFISVAYTGLFEGYVIGTRRSILDLELGDLQVHAEGYRKSPSIYNRVAGAGKLITTLEDAGFRVGPRLLGSGLAAAGSTSAGVSIRGVDIARDAQVSDVSEHIHVGRWLNSEKPRGVVLGHRLAKTLGVELGQELVILGQAADGSMANELYSVEGVLGGIAAGVDRSGVYMHEAAYRELFVVDDGIHQLIVRTPDKLALEDAKRQVALAVKSASDKPAEVATWREIVPSLASMLDNSQASMMVMYMIIYLAIATVILNAMLMSVFERVREFGVLKALGASPSRIVRLMLLESGLQATVSIVLGTLLSLPALWYLKVYGIDLTSFGSLTVEGIAFDPIWRAEINSNTFVPPISTLIVIVFMAVVYPSIRAAMISPAEAMRHH